MEFFTTLKDTPVPTLLVIGGFIFLFLGIATIKKPIVIDVTPSSRKIALILGLILVGTGLYLLSQPSPELSNDPIETSTPEIVFNVNKEETNGCYVRFNGLIVDNTSKDPITWDWGDGNFAKGFFPQEHTYAKSGSYSVIVTAPSGSVKNFMIDVECESELVATATSQSITSNVLFSLKDAQPANFYTINDSTFVFLDNGKLAITGNWGSGTYIDQKLPKNFRATIQLMIQDSDDEFMLGLSDGNKMRPNYHLVMNPTGSSFKQQLGFDITEGWDKYIKSVSFSLKPDSVYEIVFERKNGGVSVLANNVSIIGLGTQDVKDINSYDYLYITGGVHQQIIVMSLVIDEIQ
jgi:hypothetical protein